MKDTSPNNSQHRDVDPVGENSRDTFWKTDWLDVVATRNPEMHRVFEKIRSAAPTIATVLLLGETGTGKGLMARLIHRHSHRCEGPFVTVHCGAIPDTLIESELFGHEKGAFTGADRKKTGKFEMAREGTIFLDEIGTITPSAQIKLLQVLQDGTFSRIGGTEQLQTNARIIAATNADLQRMVESGTFRSDLYYRLNIFPIELLPLRERKEDIPRLIDLFLLNLSRKYGKKIHRLQPGLSEALAEYPWPGNLRELENVFERAYILATGDELGPDSFPETLMMSSRIAQTIENPEVLPLSEARQIAIDEFERAYLARLLKKHGGRINPSAEEAGVSTRQLSRLIVRHSLDKRGFKH
jgi:transcriptional regulator with PAS, ATPase and Fis domain